MLTINCNVEDMFVAVSDSNQAVSAHTFSGADVIFSSVSNGALWAAYPTYVILEIIKATSNVITTSGGWNMVIAKL